MNLALAVLAFLVNLATPGALPQGFIFSGISNNGTTYTYVGSGKNASNCGGSPCTATYSATAGNLLIVDYEVNLTGATLNGYDNVNGSTGYSQAFKDTADVSGYTFGEYFITSSASGVTTVGISYTGGSGSGGSIVTVREYSGSGGTRGLDKVSLVGTGSSTTLTAGTTAATTYTNELISGMFFDTNNSQAATGSGGYTDRIDVGDGARSIHSADKSVTSTAAYTATATVSSSSTYYGFTITYQ
jgi:hypothetical protein